MTAKKDLKNLIRNRQGKTGESYTAARVHVLRDRAELLGTASATEVSEATEPVRADAVVLKVNARSARVRILGEAGELTFRTRDVWRLVPGHLVTLVMEKRWLWRDDYANGAIENPRIATRELGLTPLPLSGGELDDLRAGREPFRRPDPYAPLWRELTAKPRWSFEMDRIAWGALPGVAPGENPIGAAAELAEEGDTLGAREVLMDLLHTDLRCIDAHVHLGNLAFDCSLERALVHYEMGMRIGELSLPAEFDGVLPWDRVFNRPFLRCLKGYGLCLWRMGKLAEAEQVLLRILSLDPHDSQGVRFCWQDVDRGRTWEDSRDGEGTGHVQRLPGVH